MATAAWRSHVLEHSMQTKLLLQELDSDGDGRISAEEWRCGLLQHTEHLSAQQFERLLWAMWNSSGATISLTMDDCQAQHPMNNTDYINSTFAKQLKAGLEATLKEMEDQQVLVASKKLWASDGYLPEHYTPGQPVRVLGEWLHENNPFVAIKASDPRQLDWGLSIPDSQLDLESKYKIAFHHLDASHCGCARC
jgi:hypothetical protein